MITLGTIIDERYEVEKVLGVGAFGQVYKAAQPQLGRRVALKIISSNVLEESDGPARFEREARAISALRHKNIVTFYGFGVWDGAPYMVMELLDGISVQSLILQGKPIPPARAVNIIQQLCEALSCAHANGIVHRDLKPSNLMLTSSSDGKEVLKIIDFGLAKLMPGYGIAAQKLTEAGFALGTCHYMSPEQCIGHAQVDHRTDIYAAGCLLYEVLTGKPPFHADDSVAVMFQHVNAPVPRLQLKAVKSDEQQALQAVLDKAMAKDIVERYQTADEMLADLNAIAAGSISALAQAGRESKPKGTPAYTALDIARITPIVLGLLLVCIGVWAFLFAQPKPAYTDRAASLYDEVSVEMARLKAKSDLHRLDLCMQKVNRTLMLNQKDHSLTHTQYMSLLREAQIAGFMLGHHNESIPYALEAISAAEPSDDTFDDRERLARAYQLSAEHDKAEKELRWILDNWTHGETAQQNLEITRVNLSLTLMMAGSYAAADKELARVNPAILKSAYLCHFYYIRGNLRFAQKRLKEARADYERGLLTTAADAQLPFVACIARVIIAEHNSSEYTKVREELLKSMTQYSYGQAVTTGCLLIILDSRLGDRESAQEAADRMITVKNPTGDPFNALNNFDVAQCEKALKQAGYNDIWNQLSARFHWAK